MDDPRLGGTLWQLWNHASIGGPKYRADGEVMSGTVALVNDDGSWVGTMRGYIFHVPMRTHYRQLELIGTGAYEGLSALAYAEGPGGGPTSSKAWSSPARCPRTGPGRGGWAVAPSRRPHCLERGRWHGPGSRH